MVRNYFLQLESLIYTHPIVKHVLNIETEIIDSNIGWFKAKLIVDSHELHIFEFVGIRNRELYLLRYGYHLQTKSGSLVIRWDTAEHHKDIETFPYHVHTKNEKNVQPSERMTIEKVLNRISEIIKTT